MRLRDSLKSALEAINARRLRSTLTVLGILIGIAAVILTVGLGQGAQSSVTSRPGSASSTVARASRTAR